MRPHGGEKPKCASKVSTIITENVAGVYLSSQCGLMFPEYCLESDISGSPDLLPPLQLKQLRLVSLRNVHPPRMLLHRHCSWSWESVAVRPERKNMNLIIIVLLDYSSQNILPGKFCFKPFYVESLNICS